MTSLKISRLELIMTNAAFGYEYALMSLQDLNELDLQAEKIKSELEQHRNVYFSARSEMAHLNQQRVEQLEDELRLQKAFLFHKQTCLH